MFGRKKTNRKVRTQEVKQKPIEIDFGDMKANYMIGNAQHIGSRNTQEDYFGFSDITNNEKISNKGICAVLSDGMGGLSNGRQVSEYTVTAVLSLFESLDYRLSVCTQLREIAKKINEQVCKEFLQGGKIQSGSTLAAAIIYKDKLFWVCIGDSRIYLLRNRYLYQLNEDHDYKNRLLKEYIEGSVPLDTAFGDPQRDSLTSYIGNPDMPFIDANRISFTLQKGDKIMLCSDGVYNMLSDFELIKRLMDEPHLASEEIVQDVLDKEETHQDNLTVLVISFD